MAEDASCDNTHHGTRKTGTVIRIASGTAEKQRCRHPERDEQ